MQRTFLILALALLAGCAAPERPLSQTPNEITICRDTWIGNHQKVEDMAVAHCALTGRIARWSNAPICGPGLEGSRFECAKE